MLLYTRIVKEKKNKKINTMDHNLDGWKKQKCWKGTKITPHKHDVFMVKTSSFPEINVTSMWVYCRELG